MILFGHLGIGNLLAKPFARGLSRRWILLGTIAPDLLDKPLYYGLVLATGKRAAELGLITGTRTFGHTGILLILISALAMARKSRVLAAIAIGAATHLLLDAVGDVYFSHQGHVGGSAILWPLKPFPVHPFSSAGEHMKSWLNPYLLGSEAAGAALLGWEAWKLRHKAEVLAFSRLRRIDLRRLKSLRRKRRHDQTS